MSEAERPGFKGLLEKMKRDEKRGKREASREQCFKQCDCEQRFFARKLPKQAVANVTRAVEEEVRREAYAAAERRGLEVNQWQRQPGAAQPSPELRASDKAAEEPFRQGAKDIF